MLIRIYSTPSCYFCHEAKSYLKDRGHEVEMIDIIKDRSQFDYIVGKTGMRKVPQIEIGDKVLVGFDKNELDKCI